MMKKTTEKTAILGLLALLTQLALPPAATAQNREHQQMAADMRIMQEQAQQLAITIAALNQALAESIKALNARLDQAADASRKGFADQKLLIDNMGNDVRVIRERSDDTNVRIAALREELEALRSTVQALAVAPIAPPAPIDPADPNAPPAPVTQVPPSLPPPSTAGLSPTRMFETAKADYAAGQWTLAITGFEQFLRAFPKSESSDDAQFYIGETNFAQGKFPDAIAAYNLVIQNYPGANAVPDAYYKRGLAQERLGQVDAARNSWDTVSKSYPESDAGRLAKQNLDRLGRTQQQR
jgi:tol-pal system protein YbgF